MNGYLTGEMPELVFFFAPSKGEQFTMTRVEVADVMAFVRELKANDDKVNSDKCPHCGGGCDGDMYRDGSIMRFKCKSCKKFWTP